MSMKTLLIVLAAVALLTAVALMHGASGALRLGPIHVAVGH